MKRRIGKTLLVGVLGLLVLLAVVFAPTTPPRPVFPDGKRFAFSIVDDTDLTTLARIRPVYESLRRHGLRTTKTVWVTTTSEPERSTNLGDSLADAPYLAFIQGLQRDGFEIALHGIRGGSSRRAEILEELEVFRRDLGQYPRMHINHSLNRDNLYWDHFRFSVWPFAVTAGVAMRGLSAGHDPGSEYYWGDVAKQHVKYVRQFTYRDINLLRVNPSMPYRRADTPDVNYWFQTADGANREAFVALLSPENLDTLEREGGVCLVYAHLGAGSFAQGDVLAPEVEARLADLASRNGWFAPASTILDFLASQPGWRGEAGWLERFRMEARFVAAELLAAVF